MKKIFAFFTLLFYFTCFLQAQVTGNSIYNSNNRFQQNDNYRSSAGKKYKSAQPSATKSLEMNGGYQWNFGDVNSSVQYFSGMGAATYTTQNSEIIMNVKVLFNARPSAYMAIFHINQAAERIADLDTLMSRRVEKFMNLAKTIGVKREQFYTDMIALVPIYSREKRMFSKTYNQVPKGFEMQKNIHVKYTDVNQLDKLFAFAAQCEIYDLIKVEYLYDSAEYAGQMMRERALNILNKKVQYFAKAGIKTDTSFRVMSEMGDVVFPIDKYHAYQPLAVSSIDDTDKPDETGMTMKTGMGMTSRSTVFYNPISLDGFDAVINPSPLQPPIQFVYQLQVRYRYNQPATIITTTKTDTKHELIIVPAQGEIKTIIK